MTRRRPPDPALWLPAFYRDLYRAFGPQHWWPGRTRLEVIVGAILTQNTSWQNVSRAIRRLRSHGKLSHRALAGLTGEELAPLIRSSGYYHQKAIKVIAFLRWLQAEYDGSLGRMFRTPLPELREKLLARKGIGPETADAILLYAGNLPVFVVDAYTRRIFFRHGLIREQLTYEELRALCERHLPRDVPLYNEYHALLVRLGNRYCRKTPRCGVCPVAERFPPLPRFRHQQHRDR